MQTKIPLVGRIYKFRNFINEPFIFITRVDRDKGVYYYYILGKNQDVDHYGYLDINLAFLEEV